jgi:hypothetical protein
MKNSLKGYLTNSTGSCFSNVVAPVSTNEVISYDLSLAKRKEGALM